jgi:phosphate transport system substrate-binding protein
MGAYWEQRDADGLVSASGDTPMLRIAGSNTIGEALAPALADAFLKQLGARDVRILHGAIADEQFVQGVLPGFLSRGGNRVEIQIAAHGSTTAFDGLMDASCDIGMASRRIKPKEFGKLASLADWSSPANEHLLALDGIAVIVNRANPLQQLTKDQLAGIFSGTFSNWSALTNQRGPIHVYAPGNKSGTFDTFDTFKTLVLGSKGLAASARRLEDSRALSDAVAADRNGIGLVGLPYILNAKAIAVAERGAFFFQPNRLTVGTEDYLLSRRLYLYTPAKPQNKYVRKFVQFALSKAGQEVVGNVGFIAHNVTSEKAVISPSAPFEYRRLTKGAARLSLDFRFLPGLTVLDSKAQADLERVVTFLADSGYSGNDLLLFGFTDNTGDRHADIAISQNRARIVAEAFARRSLRPAIVKGFGPNLPVSSNDNDAGKERNRRVEIWLREAQGVAPRAAHNPS